MHKSFAWIKQLIRNVKELQYKFNLTFEASFNTQACENILTISTALWAYDNELRPRITHWCTAQWHFCNSTPLMRQANMENFSSDSQDSGKPGHYVNIVSDVSHFQVLYSRNRFSDYTGMKTCMELNAIKDGIWLTHHTRAHACMSRCFKKFGHTNALMNSNLKSYC